MNVDFSSLEAISYIVVHAGMTSHQDEQVATALAVAYGAPCKIARRDPTPKELADPAILVLDVGGQLDWSRHNVDHHQLPRTQADCAYSLLADKLGCWEEMSTVFPWAALGAMMDQQGPFAVSKHVGINPDSLFALLGPARSYHDQRWAHDASYREAYTVWLAEQLKVQLGLYAQLKEYAYEDYMPEIEGLKVLRGDRIEKAHPEHARELIDLLAKEYRINVVVFNDDRGDGFGLLRMGDDPRINFAQCEGDARVKFAHKGGFILKTVDRQADVGDLIRMALVR